MVKNWLFVDLSDLSSNSLGQLHTKVQLQKQNASLFTNMKITFFSALTAA